MLVQDIFILFNSVWVMLPLTTNIAAKWHYIEENNYLCAVFVLYIMQFWLFSYPTCRYQASKKYMGICLMINVPTWLPGAMSSDSQEQLAVEWTSVLCNITVMLPHSIIHSLPSVRVGSQTNPTGCTVIHLFMQDYLNSVWQKLSQDYRGKTIVDLPVYCFTWM